MRIASIAPLLLWTLAVAQVSAPPGLASGPGTQPGAADSCSGCPAAAGCLTCAAPPAAATARLLDISAADVPNDVGGAVELAWTMSEEGVPADSVQVLRSAAGAEPEEAGWILPAAGSWADEGLRDGVEYTYTLVPWTGGVAGAPAGSASVVPAASWFHMGRLGMFILLTILTLVILAYIERAKRGHKLYVREIAGISAVDDAVGRATEMGRPILYIPGIMDMDDIQTIASMVILGRVASKTAEYGANLLVPNTRSVVMSVAQEVVKEAYLAAGRPDAYRRENINYLTDDQFGYAAGVDGIMVRQRPAAIFLLGTFYAESLILAETGKSVGAIQIAGTAMVSQLPFFIAACDYTLIGEELFAASAYLSHEPKLLGSLKGQDAAKLVIMILILLGVAAATLGTAWPPAAKAADFLRLLTHVD